MIQTSGPEANDNCPLCDLPAYVRTMQDFNADLVICVRCGYFQVDEFSLQDVKDERYLLSGLTRRATGTRPSAETRLKLATDNVINLVASARAESGLLEQLDLTLELVEKHQTRSNEFVEYREIIETAFPWAFARDSTEFSHFFHTLSSQEFLEEPPERDSARRTSFRITPEGWNRLRELRKTMQDSNRAFVAMWFDSELKTAYTEGIHPALEELGYVPVRIDETHEDSTIDNRIIAEIRRSGLVVADFTGHRQGVYFEAGFARGLNIPVVWTCRRDAHKETHFDTRQYQHILWDTPEDLKEQLVYHIASRFSRHPLTTT